MHTAITQALIVYALGFAISAGVAGMIKGLFVLVRRFSRGPEE
jgi:hypothetical protein